jgi:hypothetical protein
LETVGDCSSLILSVDDLTRAIREGLRQLGFKTIPEGRRISVPWRSIRWTLSGEAKSWAVVEFRTDIGPRAGITWPRYDVDHFSRRTGSQHYPVSMVTTPCRFGGSRWWWVCPATGRRVRKLYLPNGGTRFLSRGLGAYRLTYASQHRRRVDRMHDRCRRLYQRLGIDCDGPSGHCWPTKRKGMHWRTYDAICNRLEIEEHGLDLNLVLAMAKLVRKLS